MVAAATTTRRTTSERVRITEHLHRPVEKGRPYEPLFLVELREDLNKALATILANGTYARINKKYFDFDVYGAK